VLLPGRVFIYPSSASPIQPNLDVISQAGIGTYFKHGAVWSKFRGIAQLLDEGFAWYLSEHILDGYKFLMQNYYEGDTVCIFGAYLFVLEP